MNDEQGLIEIIKKMSFYLDNYNASAYTLDEFIESICSLSEHYEFSEDSEYDEELVLQEIINKACDLAETDSESEVDQFGIPLDQKKEELIEQINEYLNTDYEILGGLDDEDDYSDEDIDVDPYDDMDDS